MIILRKSRPRYRNESGFTVVELLVYLVIGLIVTGSVFQLLIGQNRLFMKQREVMDVQGSLKGAASLLAWELREISAGDGDLYSIGQSTVALRSVKGTGVICGEHGTLLRYGLWAASGEFLTTADDSVLLFSGYGTQQDDDVWKVVRATGTFDPVSGGVQECYYGDADLGKGKGKTKGKSPGKAKGSGIVPNLVLEVSGDVDGVYIGAPVRSFRRIEYGLFTSDGRWWLGQKVGAAASYEKLMGPLRAPGDSGLVFTYYDQFGNVTAVPAQVGSIEIIIRGESFGKTQQGAGSAAQQDTLSTRVSLRG